MERMELKGYALAETPDIKKVNFVALSEGVHNGVFYPASEIEKAAKNLVGKPIRIDHTDKVLETIGKVIEAEYVDTNGFRRIECIGEFYNDTETQKEAISLLTKSLITDFSVGVDVDLTMSNGVETAKDLIFKEVSLVTEGADEMAKVITLLNSKINSKELLDVLTKIANRGEKMEKKLEAEVPEVKEEEIKTAGPTEDIAPAVDAAVEKKDAELSLETLSDVINKLSERLMAIERKLKEDDEEEKPKEKPKEDEELKKLSKRLEQLENEKVKKSKILAEAGSHINLTKTNAGYQYADKNKSPFGTEYGIQRKKVI